MIKGSIQEEDITIVNIYARNIGSPQYIRQLLTALKGEIDNNTTIVGDFNTPLTTMERSSRQKIYKETQTLSEALDQIDLKDFYRTFHPKAAEYTFFSSVHRTFSLGLITFWATNQALVTLTKLKSYQASFPTTHYMTGNQKQGKNCKKHKHVETKQQAT